MKMFELIMANFFRFECLLVYVNNHGRLKNIILGEC